MARAIVLTGDLLFGSQVQGSLVAAGHGVEIVADQPALIARLSDHSEGPAAVLVVDLTDERLDGAGILEAMRGGGELGSTRTLAFYSHVDLAARERAERAGFDLIVARSRMAREGAELVSGLASR